MPVVLPVPTLPAEGRYALPVQNLRKLVAKSARFRTVVGAATEAEAREYVFYWWAQQPQVMPFATVDFPDRKPFDSTRSSTTNTFSKGPLSLVFAFATPTAHLNDHFQDAGLWFHNQVGVIVDEMEIARRNDPTLLNIVEYEKFLFGEGAPDNFYTAPYWIGEILCHIQGR